MYVEGTLSLNPKPQHLFWEHSTHQVTCKLLVYFGGHIINKNPLCLCKSGAHFKKTHTHQEEGHFVLLEGILSRGTSHSGGSPKYKWPRSSVTEPSLAFCECPHLWVLTPSWGNDGGCIDYKKSTFCMCLVETLFINLGSTMFYTTSDHD
jgi:hypothetical protein